MPHIDSSNRDKMTFLLTVLLPLSLLASRAALAAPGIETVVRFDAERGELSEGVAIDARGNLYVSLAPLGEIRKIAPDGTASVFADLADGIAGAPGVLGLAADARGNLYAAVVTFDPATHGVWEIAPDGSKRRLTGSQAMVWPNALAFDDRANLFVTDSVAGAVWRFPIVGGAGQSWLQHPMLAGTDELPETPPLGANGIAHRRGELLVANTEKKQVVVIPIQSDGSPGEPALLAGGFNYLDGLAVDIHGNVYLLVIGDLALVRLDPDGGSATVLATLEDGLDFPASLAFGHGARDRQSVFVTNFAILDLPLAERPGPGVVRVRVGEPGPPLPGPPPPSTEWMRSPELPGFRFQVRITTPGGEQVETAAEPICLRDAFCASGALPGRPEAVARLMGPRPNGFLWLVVSKLTPSAVDVWVEQEATGQVVYHHLPPEAPGNEPLLGVIDRFAFMP